MAGRSLHLTGAPESGGASLALGRRGRIVLLTEAPACDPAVLVGHPYRATLQYAGTAASLSLEVLAHSRQGWRLWYTAAARLRPSRVSSRARCCCERCSPGSTASHSGCC